MPARIGDQRLDLAAILKIDHNPAGVAGRELRIERHGVDDLDLLAERRQRRLVEATIYRQVIKRDVEILERNRQHVLGVVRPDRIVVDDVRAALWEVQRDLPNLRWT